MKSKYLGNILIIIAIIFGVVSGYIGHPYFFLAADSVSEIFIRLLKLISLPIIFLSIVSTLSGMKSFDEMKTLSKKVLKYTIFSTLLAAGIGLVLFWILDPVNISLAKVSGSATPHQTSYMSYLLSIVPSNVVEAFIENNVVGIAFIAAILGLAILSLPEDNRKLVSTFFSSLFAALLKITGCVITLIPIGIWAFTTLFIRDIQANMPHVHSLVLYIACVLLANILQGAVVLPILLKFKGLSPLKVVRGMSPALVIAFFTKSSNATLPTSLKCAEGNLGISRRVSTFSLPLCSVINMNGCAAFILITVLFVSMSYGVTYSTMEMISWIFIATIAAIGNAGIPMGCYFMTSAFLVGMDIPLHIIGIILPIYTIIDMVETALNVWSDSCITAIVDKETTSLVNPAV